MSFLSRLGPQKRKNSAVRKTWKEAKNGNWDLPILGEGKYELQAPEVRILSNQCCQGVYQIVEFFLYF